MMAMHLLQELKALSPGQGWHGRRSVGMSADEVEKNVREQGSCDDSTRVQLRAGGSLADASLCKYSEHEIS